jgi:catechol 2,3-dioxygenase-like lactoylglutathione lyase family enzyme
MHRITTALIATLLIAATTSADETKTIADFLAKPSLNVVITVSDMEKAKEFYGGVLGLEPMSQIPFSDKTDPVFFPHPVIMERFKVGGHEIKLIPGLDTTKKHEGGISTGIGFRMVNYPITDVDAFKKRLAKHGYAEPVINKMPPNSGGWSTYRFGMLEDPDGNQVEFFYHEDGGPEGWEESIQIALTVSDVEATRRFYGKVLGIPELPSVPMPGGDTRVYLFQQGPTLIKFWSFGDQLPNRAGRHLEAYGNRFIQYPLKNITEAHAWVKAQGATMNLEPTTVFEGTPLKIMFVADPDNIVNEMFGYAR